MFFAKTRDSERICEINKEKTGILRFPIFGLMWLALAVPTQLELDYSHSPPPIDIFFSPFLLFLAIRTWWLKKSGFYGTINI